jgi:hypothetical protein
MFNLKYTMPSDVYIVSVAYMIHLKIMHILPDDLLDTVSNVVTPNVVLPATESTSIQKETHEITTISIVGR